jgi:hypothetical protein
MRVGQKRKFTTFVFVCEGGCLPLGEKNQEPEPDEHRSDTRQKAASEKKKLALKYPVSGQKRDPERHKK